MEKLFEIANQMKEFSNALKIAKENVDGLDAEQLIKELQQYKAGENREFFIKRKLRGAYKGVYEFLAKYGDENNVFLTTFLSLCCYNLDWDNVFDVIEINKGEDFYFLTDFQGNRVDMSRGYNVLSWGSIRDKFDTNFLRFVRNGLAHGKFDCDFENQKITVKMRNDTFVVEMPMKFMFIQPYSLYNIFDKTSVEGKKETLIILGEATPPYTKAIELTIKNSETDCNDEILRNKKIPKVFRRFLAECRGKIDEFENENNHKLGAKSKLVALGPEFLEAISLRFPDLNERLSVFTMVAEYVGVSVERSKFVDYEKDIYKTNRFVKYAVENTSLKNGEFEKLIASKVSQESQSFYAYFQLLGIILSTSSNGEARFADMARKSLMFVNMEEICEFADRAYVNFVCNYLEGKVKIDDSWKSVSADEYFLPNGFTRSNSVYDIFQASQNKAYIRNCLVHPEFFKFDGENYHFTDYDKSGALVFDGEISRENLIRFATDILDKFQSQYYSHESEEEL